MCGIGCCDGSEETTEEEAHAGIIAKLAASPLNRVPGAETIFPWAATNGRACEGRCKPAVDMGCLSGDDQAVLGSYVENRKAQLARELKNGQSSSPPAAKSASSGVVAVKRARFSSSSAARS